MKCERSEPEKIEIELSRANSYNLMWAKRAEEIEKLKCRERSERKIFGKLCTFPPNCSKFRSDYLFSFQNRTGYLFPVFLRSEYLFPKSARPPLRIKWSSPKSRGRIPPTGPSFVHTLRGSQTLIHTVSASKSSFPTPDFTVWTWSYSIMDFNDGVIKDVQSRTDTSIGFRQRKSLWSQMW